MILIDAESLSFWRIYILLTVVFILVYGILENDFVFHIYSNSAQKRVTVLICLCFRTMCLLWFSLCILKYVIVPCYGSARLHEGFKFLLNKQGPLPVYFPAVVGTLNTTDSLIALTVLLSPFLPFFCFQVPSVVLQW